MNYVYLIALTRSRIKEWLGTMHGVSVERDDQHGCLILNLKLQHSTLTENFFYQLFRGKVASGLWRIIQEEFLKIFSGYAESRSRKTDFQKVKKVLKCSLSLFTVTVSVRLNGLIGIGDFPATAEIHMNVEKRVEAIQSKESQERLMGLCDALLVQKEKVHPTVLQIFEDIKSAKLLRGRCTLD